MALKDLVDLASQHLLDARVHPSARGRQMRGPCPLHADSNPSFGLNLDTGAWHCWGGCGSGWVTSLLERLGYSKDTIRDIANGATPPKKKTPQQRWIERGKTATHVLPELTLALFDRCPIRLLEQGWSEEVLFEFEVGYDTPQGRITCPIRDRTGTLTAIAGRAAYPYQEPKYKVYEAEDLYETAPETYLPDNKQHIYGAHLIDPNDPRPIPLVEGYKGVWRLWEHGFPGLALMGSSVTNAQLNILRLIYRLTKRRFIVAFDNDEAGRAGAYWVCKGLLQVDNPLVVFTDDVKDLSEYYQHDPIAKTLDKAAPFLSHQLSLKRPERLDLHAN